MIDINIYSWKDSPYNLKRLSDHGGDEDWVAVSEDRLTELDQECYLPRCNSLQEVFDNATDCWVYIGAHG